MAGTGIVITEIFMGKYWIQWGDDWINKRPRRGFEEPGIVYDHRELGLRGRENNEEQEISHYITCNQKCSKTPPKLRYAKYMIPFAMQDETSVEADYVVPWPIHWHWRGLELRDKSGTSYWVRRDMTGYEVECKPHQVQMTLCILG
jgi:hypothetical protein